MAWAVVSSKAMVLLLLIQCAIVAFPGHNHFLHCFDDHRLMMIDQKNAVFIINIKIPCTVSIHSLSWSVAFAYAESFPLTIFVQPYTRVKGL